MQPLLKLVLTILLILHLSHIGEPLSGIRPYYENQAIRLAYLFTLAVMSQYDVLIAILMGMAYISTHQVLAEKSIVEGFIEGFMD